jgi:cobalt/nickel transport protein
MTRKSVWILFLISLLIVIILSPFASPWPDGLETVSEKYGLTKYEQEPLVKCLFPDYEANFINSPYLKVVIPGIFGTALTFAVTSGLYLALTRRKESGTRISG